MSDVELAASPPTSTSRGGIQTALTQAYIGQKTDAIKNEIQSLVGMGGQQGEDGFSDEPTSSTANGGKASIPRTLWSSAVFAIVAGALGMNILIVLVVKGTITYLAGFFAAITSIWVALSELKLEDLPSLRQVQNNLREDVNHFAIQNTKLTTHVNGLETNVTSLKGTEEQFKELTKEQSINMTSLTALVKESKDINVAMQKCIRRDIVSQLITTSLDNERDENMEFDEREMKRLLNFMKALPAVTINEPKLMEAMEENKTLIGLVNLIMDVALTGTQKGDEIFIIDHDNPELQAHVIDSKV